MSPKTVKPRHLLAMDDLSGEEIGTVLDNALIMKRLWDRSRYTRGSLRDIGVSAIFQSPSNRTWSSLSEGVQRHGGRITYIDGRNVFKRENGGERESVRDIMGTQEQYFDFVCARLLRQETLDEMGRYAKRAHVVNLLTAKEHPLQALADTATMKLEFGDRFPGDLKVAWVGDRSEVEVSLAKALVKLGVGQFAHAGPKKYWLPPDQWQIIEQLARESGTRLTRTEDPREAVTDADVVETDTFAFMGVRAEKAARRVAFQRYQINKALMRAAKPNAIFLHCLPAHPGEEVEEEVLHGPQSRVFVEARLRLETQVAVMELLKVSR